MLTPVGPTPNLREDHVTDAVAPEPTESGTVRLLVWDDPDVRTRTADVLVADVPADAGPNLERVYLWLLGRCSPGETAEACLFTTVRPGDEDSTAAKVTHVRLQGFAVLVRPEQPPGHTDLAAAMWAHVERLADAGALREVVVASHNAGAFAGRLTTLAARGVTVTVLGFRERASYAAGRPGITFVDLEDVPGAYNQSLPRTNLFDLPTDGRALPPLRLPQLPALNPAPQPVPIAPVAVPEATAATAAPEAPQAPVAGPAPAPLPPTFDPAIAPPPPAPTPAPEPVPVAEAAPGPDAPTPFPAPPAAEPVAEERVPAGLTVPPPPPAPPVPPWRTASPVTATPIQTPVAEDPTVRPGRVSPPNGN